MGIGTRLGRLAAVLIIAAPFATGCAAEMADPAYEDGDKATTDPIPFDYTHGQPRAAELGVRTDALTLEYDRPTADFEVRGLGHAFIPTSSPEERVSMRGQRFDVVATEAGRLSIDIDGMPAAILHLWSNQSATCDDLENRTWFQRFYATGVGDGNSLTFNLSVGSVGHFNSSTSTIVMGDARAGCNMFMVWPRKLSSQCGEEEGQPACAETFSFLATIEGG